MNPFVVDPTHIDVLLSVALNGPSDQPDALGWHVPSAGELSGDPGPLHRPQASEIGAALMAMCIGSVRHFYAGTGVPRLPGPDPLPDPALYEWSDFGRFLTIHEAFVALSCYELNSNCHPRWFASPQYALCNRRRARLVASLPGCSGSRLHWSTEGVLDRAAGRQSLGRVLGISAEAGEDGEAPPLRSS